MYHQSAQPDSISSCHCLVRYLLPWLDWLTSWRHFSFLWNFGRTVAEISPVWSFPAHASFFLSDADETAFPALLFVIFQTEVHLWLLSTDLGDLWSPQNCQTAFCSNVYFWGFLTSLIVYRMVEVDIEVSLLSENMGLLWPKLHFQNTDFQRCP